MSPHWTYAEPKEQSMDLEQGDILLPNDQLGSLFEEVHPHFCDPRYSAFMIVTQSCDLVRRGHDRKCKADYINLAVIRPLQDVIPMFLEPICGTGTSGIYQKEKKIDANQFFERLFNQNEQNAGLFYLHPDNENAGIAQPSVVLLRVAIAVRAHQHYETLIESRRGSLRSDFQCKLGWLMGNIYSRVGTPDWNETDLDRMIDNNFPKSNFIWTENFLYQEAIKKGISFVDLSVAEKHAKLEECRPQPFKEVLAEQASLEAKKVIDRVRSMLSNRPQEADTINSSVEIISLINEKLETIPKTIGNRLKNNRFFARAVDGGIR